MNSKNSNELVQSYYRDYAKYVLETRALPGIMDGCKSVQRRIIYAAYQQPNKLMKTANLAGSVMRYHPHGSSEGAINNMASPVNPVKLFDIKGNFGGYGYSAAAGRYTECKLSDIARFIFCQFIDYAEYHEGEIGIQEPVYLPSLLPLALLNGSDGIGVGLSTNICPLNVMDLIDYYIHYIETGNFDYRIPRPEFGAMVMNQDDESCSNSVREYTGPLWMYPLIKRESETTFVIESLYGKDISAVTKKLSWAINDDIVDFRDESSKKERYVFELVDPKRLSPEELEEYLIKYSKRKETFTRVMVDLDGSAVYTNLNNIIIHTLEGLNKAIDKMIDTQTKKYEKQLEIYRALWSLRNEGFFNKYGVTSDYDYLINKMKEVMKFSEDLCVEIMKKPISYLTSHHDKERESLEKQLNELYTHDRKTYLIDMYKKLKEMLMPDYLDRKHTVLMSEVLTNPKVRLIDDKLEIFEGSQHGKKFTSIVYLVGKSGTIYRRVVGSPVRSTLETDISEPIIGFTTDAYKYIEIQSKEGKVDRGFSLETDKITYDKKWINLYDDEKLTKVLDWNDAPERVSSNLRMKVGRTSRY